MKIKTVKDIPEDFVLSQFPSDVEETADMLGVPRNEYDYFFLRVGEGEYLEAYGCNGLGLNYPVYKVL